MRAAYMALAGFLLAGCVGVTDVGLPDGSSGYSLNCSAAGMTWGSCLQKAAELCKGRGYNILARDEKTGVVSTITANQYGAFGSSHLATMREMIVQCR